jgi:hypothetical protein
MDSALVDAGSYNTFHRGLVQVQTPDQQHMEWWGILLLHCQSVPSFVCFGIGNFVVAFCFAVCCSVHSNIKLLCNKHLNFSNIQRRDFCATDSLNFSLFKQQTFVQQTVWTSVYSNIKLLCNRDWISVHSNSKHLCNRHRISVVGFLRFSKSLKTCRVLVLQKYLICVIFIVLNISSTFGLWVIWRLIVAPCQRLLLFRDENKNPVCVPQ